MKTVLTLFMYAITSLVMAQPENSNKEKMKVFASWAGTWRGEGQMQMGPGEPRRSTVEEKIEPKFDGGIYLIEGIGKAVNPTTKEEIVVHHAFAVLSYDQVSGKYQVRTYLKDGRNADAWFNVLGENKFEWGFDVPTRGKTRYIITIDPAKKTWNEVGEFSADGNAWNKFFEMNLKKI